MSNCSVIWNSTLEEIVEKDKAEHCIFQGRLCFRTGGGGGMAA